MAKIVDLNAAAEYDIKCKQGDTFYMKVNVSEYDPDTEQYVDFDFTTYTVNFWVRTSGKQGYPILKFSSEDGTIVLTTGKMELHQTAEVMADTIPGEYVYDCDFYNSQDDSVKTYMQGRFAIEIEYTK